MSRKLSKRPAYKALQRRFREWIQVENVRARLAHQKAEAEYTALRPLVVADSIAFDLDPNFDFSNCLFDVETAKRLKRYLALNVTLDREEARIAAIDAALAGIPTSAFMQFIQSHNEGDMELYDAMVAELIAV